MGCNMNLSGILVHLVIGGIVCGGVLLFMAGYTGTTLFPTEVQQKQMSACELQYHDSYKAAFCGTKYAPKEPDFHKNITVIGKGDGFWGLYSCKLLATDGINYKVIDERLCEAARTDHTYDVVIGRTQQQDLIPNLIIAGNISSLN